jgi:hypothetical protein
MNRWINFSKKRNYRDILAIRMHRPFITLKFQNIRGLPVSAIDANNGASTRPDHMTTGRGVRNRCVTNNAVHYQAFGDDEARSALRSVTFRVISRRIEKGYALKQIFVNPGHVSACQHT